MLAFLSIARLNKRPVSVLCSTTHLGFFSYSTTSSLLVRYLSSSFKKPRKNAAETDDFTVSYLMKSCGLSLESAKSVSKSVHFDSPKKPDSVVNLLKSHGFTDAHISKLVRRMPTVLLAKPEKTVLPKLKFLRSIGASDADLAKICCSPQRMLLRSLDNYLIPCYDILKTVVLVDEKVIKAMMHCTWSGYKSLQSRLVPNIALLRKIGVPQSSLNHLVCGYAGTAFLNPSKFEAAVEEVKRMGFDHMKIMFVLAVIVIASNSRSNIERKLEILGKWGWSRDKALLAFKRAPHYLTVSEEKITRVMNFLVSKLGWPSSEVAKYPTALMLSFERRTVPRLSVVQVLLEKGLIKKVALSRVLSPNEEVFLKNFIIKYADSVPELLSLYKAKMISM